MNTALSTNVKGTPPKRGTHAFTLIELLMGVVIFGIVLAAINTVFYSALRLRTRTVSALDTSHAMDQALGTLRRDLLNLVPPGGLLSPSFKIGSVAASLNAPQSPGIEFYTSTGVIGETAPWGEVQKVIYQLRDPVDITQAAGKDLVRLVTRNLLATTTEEALVQRLMGDVEMLEFQAFTGREWRTTWDTSLSETNLPRAIRVRVLMAVGEGRSTQDRQPMELIVPLSAQIRTNAVSSSTGMGGEQ